jgi:1,4-dihydroxy-2-naphthoyl-CoA synthase
MNIGPEGPIYLAIDPGERHIGLVLWRHGRARARTMEWPENIGIGRITQDLARYVRDQRVACVAIESYRVRPQGHNAFTEAKTIKLIGALEAAFELMNVRCVLVRPDSETKAAFYWRDDAFWNDKHQQSAARVLGVLIQEQETVK